MWNANNSSFNVTGGGFFNEPNNLDSPAPKRNSERRHQSIVPVFIRQIRDNTEDDFKLFGKPVQIVTIVGILKEYEVQSTKATYEVEDHTGRITALWWLENDGDNAPNLPVVKEGCYLRIFGSIRVQDGKKVIMVMKMRPVDKLNEVTTHMLEVVQTRLETEVLSKGVGLTGINVNNPGADLVNSMSFMAGDGNSTMQMGLTPTQEKVFRILQSVTNTPAGMPRQTVLQNFHVSQHREVNAALDFLISEGHAYSTIDVDHFKVTDSM